MPRKKPTLSPIDIGFISSPSINRIERIFFDLNKNFINNSWIAPNNRYKTNCVTQIFNDVKYGHLNKRDLGEYIVASTPTHCLDGWSYLGRAIECHNRGDISNAKHLGYYAELRAAMSILASQGIGIFDKQHFIIDPNGEAQQLSSSHGTHTMVWLVLQEWAKHQPSKDLLTKVVQPLSIPLDQWLVFFMGSSSTAQDIANKMFTSWGLDLSKINTDQYTRNEASYRPNRISNFQPQNFVQDLRFLHEFWDLFEYGGKTGFSKLDLNLLRLFLHAWIAAKTNIEDFYQDPTISADFELRVSYMLSKMGFDSSQEVRYKKFLVNRNFQYPLVITESSKDSPSNSFNQHIELLSRASLLLRIASGANQNLFINSKFSKNDVQYWWEPLGVERGLWASNNNPTNFSGLWDDIEGALIDTKPYFDDNSLRLYDCQKNHGFSIAKLGECERIALWGFGI